MHKRLIHQEVGELPGDRLHFFRQDIMNRETQNGVLCSETSILLISVELCLKAIKITC